MKKIISMLLILVMVLALYGCGKADDYEAAVVLMDGGKYEEAITAFTELGDYEDSIQKLEECKNIMAYNDAIALFEAEKFGEALSIFSSLGDYNDSAEKVAECENALAYIRAIALIGEGSYAKAREVFETIPDYKDVSEYLARYTTIEITPENWETYFTAAENPLWQKDAFGEGELFGVQNCLALREEYKDFLITANVAMGFTTNWSSYVIEIDSKNFQYTITDKLVWDHKVKDTSTITFTETSDISELVIDHCEVYYDNREDYWYVYKTNTITLDRVKGSIVLFQ